MTQLALNVINKLREQQLKSRSLYLSCIVPAYNEDKNIVPFIRALNKQMHKYTDKFEIIIIDDGSYDETSHLTLKMRGQQTKLIKFSRNFGKEIALTAGLEHCSGDIAIIIDCDFQHPIHIINDFIHQWLLGYDMVYGVRSDRNNETWLKKYLAKCFYKIIEYITPHQIPKNAGDFRLLDRKVVNAIIACGENERFMKGLYSWVGFNSIGIPYVVEDRQQGKSGWRYRHLAELAITGITSFSNIPLRIWILIGGIISCFSFSYAVWIILKTIIYGIDMPGYATLIVSIMFFGGIQLLSIGILGEYIARIFNEVKQRPKYLIDEKHGFD